MIELPDFSKARCLENVYFENCTSLRTVHPSIFSLDKLEVLELNGCESLTSLRTDVHVKSLRRLSLFSCSRLKDFSVVSENMRDLNLAATAISGLPSSLGLLSKLENLNLHQCESLKTLPNKLSGLKSLCELRIHDCKQLNASNLHFIFEGLQSLEVLWLDNCCNLFELPDNISSLSSLVSLSMRKTAVQTLPAGIKELSRLQYLSLEKCKSLRSLPKIPTSVENLYACDCTSLQRVHFTPTSAELSIGNRIRIDFRNCLKLQEYSLKAIRASALLEINRSVSAIEKLDYMNNQAVVIFPGSTVPQWLMYRTTQASITIDLSSAPLSMDWDWGFIFCVVVPQSPSKQSFYVVCEGYEGDGYTDEDDSDELEEFFSSSSQMARAFNLDHVFLWYDEIFGSEVHERIQATRTDEKNKTYNSKISLKFKVYYLQDSGDEDCYDYDSLECEEPQKVFMEIKECGVCPTYGSAYQNSIKKMELELESHTNAIEMEVGSSYGDKDENGTLSGKSKKLVFPTLPTGTWKNGTKGLKDIMFL